MTEDDVAAGQAIEKRIAELAERLFPDAMVDVACDAPADASAEQIIAMAREAATQKARAIVGSETSG